MIVLLSLLPAPALADYPEFVAELEEERTELAEDRDRPTEALRRQLQQRMLKVAEEWMGTRWGLGRPQAKQPGDGKINCGMFVATVLGDAGIEVDRVKLQRQPAELIIKTFSKSDDIRRFRNDPVETFLTGTREMGDGLYIIGLDFHVGLLHVDGDDVRFIHASYVTHTVVSEDAASAEPIVTSKYRVVGKLLDDRMIRRWLDGERYRVVGNW